MAVPRKVGALVFLGATLAAGCSATPESAAPAPCPAPPTEAARAAALDLAPAIAASQGSAPRGDALFAEHCERCHGADVSARESRLFREYPRLDCPGYLAATPDAYLAAVIQHGGEPFGLKSVMKPFADKLDDDAVADLLAHLRRTPQAGGSNR